MNFRGFKNTFYLMIKQYFFVLFFLLGLVFSQDPPEEFNYNISIYQSFYFFINSDIDGDPLLENEDWIAAFSEYDETMGGLCVNIGDEVDDNEFTDDCIDVNDDGTINIIDIVQTVNIILGDTPPTPLENCAADSNQDGTINVIDIVALVNYILSS